MKPSCIYSTICRSFSCDFINVYILYSLHSDKKKINGRDMVRELAKYVCASAEIIEEIGVWKMPEFPVSGKDLIGTGVKTGPIMRRVLTHLFELWKKVKLLLFSRLL